MQVTYSPAYTIVPTYECFNHCSYCNFRVDPGADIWMPLATARQRLEQLQGQGVCEILILSGEVHPRSSRRSLWLEHLINLCQLAIDYGFLPHTNCGILSLAEMAELKKVNVSMGLMVEQITPKLLENVHRHAPGKVPALRLEQLEFAGQLKIPYTTGLLLGIGEIETDWVDSLEAIAEIQNKYGHIQEVILQPYSPGSKEAHPKHHQLTSFDPQKLPQVINLARQILPASIAIQIPPNLVPDPQWLLACLDAGARDLGGISPFDEVNPDYPHHQELQAQLSKNNYQLIPRLPIYPQYLSWLDSKLQDLALSWLKYFQNPDYFPQAINTDFTNPDNSTNLTNSTIPGYLVNAN